MDEPTPEGQVLPVTPTRGPAPHGHRAPAGLYPLLPCHTLVRGGAGRQALGRGRELAWGAERVRELACHPTTCSFLQPAREGAGLGGACRPDPGWEVAGAAGWGSGPRETKPSKPG